ncbi:hypothetical protein CERZMDRAFT_33975 [Cercospora zeae-maydis SCOH1-5]|uniref:Oxidase ustYa n=1 Tax=Cercospora zeae-maydis SCOH1-5 TaxID=717836 RepID=A0A6A6FSI5_9PEZI|nr:hypothetical protein CERZMDRAFT_33975 [Cercospora zeae-maydis SCOH1-5]
MYTTDFTSEAQSLKIRQRWSDLMPRGNGVIHVEPNSDHKLLQHSFVSESSNGTSVQLVSWVHQLHCLYALMDAYDAVVQFGSDGAEGEVLKGHKQVHSSHCFDYLRQTILCNMDSALEGAREPGGKGTDGWDAYHTCRNYDEVKAWTESLRMSDDQWILLPGDSRIGNGGRYPDPHSGHT